MRVLAVDDDPLVLDVIVAMLEDLGCEVITASGGTEALRQLQREDRIGVLLTDINMPGLSGHELAEQARRIRPDLKIIFLSGREADGRGFPLVRKPFLEIDLARVMEQANAAC